MIIQTTNLSKHYGRIHALRGIDLHIEPGEIYGLLGPNGAGKTTTLRLLLDLIRPSTGTVSMFGLDLATHSVAIRRRLGYLPGDLTLYPNMTGHQFLKLCAGLRGHRDPRPAQRLAERFDLDLRRKCGDLSKGNRQKLGVVQAFLHEPELVILDEPGSGLDPVVQRELHDHLREFAFAGGTVLFSSHVLSEVEHVADRVGILLAGEMAVQDRVDRLKANALRELEFTFAEPVAPQRFAALPGVREASADGTIMRCRVAGTVGELLREVAALPVLNVTSHEPDLEDIFLDYVEGKVARHVA